MDRDEGSGLLNDLTKPVLEGGGVSKKSVEELCLVNLGELMVT